jgi:hypothetical protein
MLLQNNPLSIYNSTDGSVEACRVADAQNRFTELRIMNSRKIEYIFRKGVSTYFYALILVGYRGQSLMNIMFTFGNFFCYRL